jgi:hypothetical protein
MVDTQVSLQTIREYFGMTGVQFRKEWTQLTAEDKDHIRTGLTNGTENY